MHVYNRTYFWSSSSSSSLSVYLVKKETCVNNKKQYVPGVRKTKTALTAALFVGPGMGRQWLQTLMLFLLLLLLLGFFLLSDFQIPETFPFLNRS